MIFLNEIRAWVWGAPLIILLLGTGIYLTILLKGLQFRTLFSSLYLALIKRKEYDAHPGDISHFQALMTALSATVGTGNIAGVASAIAIGGPGALFWMWLTGLFGMATKYSEAVLAVKYREVDALGTMSGGPMYYIEKGLKNKWLAFIFALFAACAAFGTGNIIQSNSVAEAMHATFNVPSWVTGIFLLMITYLVIMGGIKSIAKAASAIVPFMILFYIIVGTVILILFYKNIPHAFTLIFVHAFTPVAAAGGFAGAGVKMAMQMGVSRGLLSNESGLGSSPIAAAAAKTDEPVRQALVSMTQTFIDTIIVCTFTGLVILVTGAWETGKTAAALTEHAFSMGLPGTWGGIVVSISLIFFAYSTILGWSYYGEKAIEYIAGERAIKPYRLLWVIIVFIGAVGRLDVVWAVTDIMNGLMAFPNLIALLGLSFVIKNETNHFFSKHTTI
ncbi:MAG TPA: sodium:alanine symporter family protein [Spirochaetota bacterium]|nr:sodium:alanine symporter family protein [Spirochaetota bacterium]HOM87880.1 sodium:alanine symporter family protein [Spirochaetota bacterium]HOR92450.1 sodium:alanine symporter family protein [Spirochaetota bacterium]HPD06180.1 sodium:alanine symporter family protein [Spirochaetota bacterium]HPK45228.1 sodium:alanine symporter family protein [Spirochaetota bacterium]